MRCLDVSYRARFQIALAGLLCACAGSATGPAAGGVAAIRIASLPVVTLEPGTEQGLELQALDPSGRVTSLPAVSWSSDTPGHASVSEDGVVRGVAPGHAWIHVSGPGDAEDSVAVWVQKPESAPSTFHITLIYSDDVPDFWRERLEEAATRWEQVIRDTLPAVNIATLQHHCSVVATEQQLPEQTGLENGTRIFIAISDQFPPGTYVSALGGPCRQRPLPAPTTALGQITLNRDYFDHPEDLTRLRYVAHHEMGHTLGIAGIVQGFQPPYIDVERGLYRGHLALEGYRRQFGNPVFELDISNGAHWPFAGLMGVTGPLDGITQASAGMLMDFGYPAAWYGAGAY